MTGRRELEVVHGQASAEDVSALHSVLLATTTSADPLTRWRARRRAALRAHPEALPDPGRR